ncbi:hypothetical protein GCM10027422_06280 [Hymenobacter arcticus]
MPEPYPVTVADGIFRFTTDHAIPYSARFLEMPLPADVQLAGLVFDFSFFPDGPTVGPEDARVAATLFYLIWRFFETQRAYILLYICESSDEKHFARQRLFTRWRLVNDRVGQFQQLPIEITASEPAIVGGLLFRQDHPLRTEIIAFLRAEIQLCTEAKGQ